MFVFDEAFKTTHLPYLAFAAGHNAQYVLYLATSNPIPDLPYTYESFNHEIQVLTIFRLHAKKKKKNNMIKTF